MNTRVSESSEEIENEVNQSEHDEGHTSYVCICPFPGYAYVYKSTVWHAAAVTAGAIYPTISIGTILAVNQLVDFPYKSAVIWGLLGGTVATSVIATGSFLFFGTKKKPTPEEEHNLLNSNKPAI